MGGTQLNRDDHLMTCICAYFYVCLSVHLHFFFIFDNDEAEIAWKNNSNKNFIYT